ncbi:galactose-6-phosphate isomerase, partial [Staphylococcus aureus]
DSEFVGDTIAKNEVKGFVKCKYDGVRHKICEDMLNKMC